MTLFASAVLLTLGAGALAPLLNLPEALLRETGLFLIAYAALVGWLGTRQAMPNLGSLVREGVMIMMTRHGPVPPGRRMFEVSAEETIELARMQGLHPVLNLRAESSQEANRAAGITWTNLAFVKARK